MCSFCAQSHDHGIQGPAFTERSLRETPLLYLTLFLPPHSPWEEVKAVGRTLTFGNGFSYLLLHDKPP